MMSIQVYLGRKCSGYKLVSDLRVHRISFHHAVEQVHYIHVIVIVVLACMSLYKCSTRSILPSFHQLRDKRTERICHNYF